MNKVLLGSAITVLLLAGCGDEKKTTAEATKVATEQSTTKEVVTEATKDVAQTVTKAATEVTNTVTEATNKVVENTSEAVKETTANVMETAKEVVSASDTTVKEATNTAVTETAAKVEEVKESTKEIAVAVVEETKEVAATAVAQGETAVAAAVTTAEAVVANATEGVAPVAEGLDGEGIYKYCASCHGQKAEKEALGKSQVIAGWDKEKTIQALNGYKAGTYGGVMKNIMKGQVATKTDAEIDALATFISKL